MSSIQREDSAFYAKRRTSSHDNRTRTNSRARCEPKLRFASLAHHLIKERVWENLCQIPTKSAAGVDGQTVTEAKESFEEWIAGMLQSLHRQGYRAPDIRRVY